ncbi:Predicted ATP-dependent protease [Persephonella hydrogeniphila]|uniref:endopeptidase La n=1 Tax=Persephonella hydrogeniphila TaxID=198703 RepID=A0A285NBG2_9AQUI|nr:ATP-binding protein [Persephonella hydrogeniphila]SNZ06277.1 Predicted ATP-dependent protease [Persephonella hydrogeniphila]
MAVKHLSVEDIRIAYKIEKPTYSVEPEPVFFGQERVENAFNTALKTEKEGYNLYVAGPEGIGKITYSLIRLKKEAALKPSPEDIFYHANFEEPQKPKFVMVPAGTGRKLSKDIDRIIENLKETVVRQFESKEFEDEKVRLIKNIEEKKQKVLEALKKDAQNYGLAPVITPAGIQFLPVVQGKASPEFLKIPEIKVEFEKKLELFDEKFRDYLRQLRDLDYQLFENLRELKEKVSRYVVDNAFFKVEEKYRKIPQITDFLNYLKRHIAERIDIFIRWKMFEGDFLLQKAVEREIDIFRINVVVDNSKQEGAPVLYEQIPTFKSLFGYISYKAEMGILYADHMSIVAGSLFKVRGGYIVLKAKDVLKNPLLWENLKRIIFHKKIYLSHYPFEEVFPFHVGIYPEPVPFNITVVLVGDSFLYRVLSLYDSDFNRLFKVKAEFDPVVDINEEIINRFPILVKNIIVQEKLKDVDTDGLTELFRYAVERSGSRKKINTIFSVLTDILREADALSDKKYITGETVKRIIKNRRFRLNLIEEKIRELFREGKLIVDIKGKKAAQVNGLSVIELGDFSFGKPSRITAASYIGEKGIINIEREVELSGPIHSKGVMILSGYVGQKYGKDTPLALSCSIAFEQSYGEVEGDSASAAELIAVLSSIGEIPVRQDISITGSVDQLGNIQPVGGIKEKIEGFYKVCKVIGLTGNQGVIVPSRNFDNIILDEEVLEAVREKKFHIYTVDTVDDAVKILTEMNPLEFHRQIKEKLVEYYQQAIKGKK